MTDQPLTNPDGVAYPSTVQLVAHHYFPDLDNPEAQRRRRDLRDALEAAIAADREHRPPPPELDEEHTRRLMRLFLSGFYSGSRSTITNLGLMGTDAAGEVASHYVWHIEADPAVYTTIETDAVELFVLGKNPDRRRIVAHSHDLPRDQKDD